MNISIDNHINVTIFRRSHKSTHLKRVVPFTQKLYLTTLLLSLAYIPLAHATLEDDFIAATPPRHRSDNWSDISKDQIIPCPLLPATNSVALIKRHPFSLIKVSCDDTVLSSTKLANGGERWRGKVKGEDVDLDLDITFTWKNETHTPEITQILNHANGQKIQEGPLEDVAEDRSFVLGRPLSTDPQSLHWFKEEFARFQGSPRVTLFGNLASGRKIQMDFEQWEGGDLILYPLENANLLYVKDGDRFGLFCEMKLPGFGSFFQNIKEWNLKSTKRKTIKAEIYYDGKNIYDRVTTPCWLNDWTSTQLTQENRKRLMVATLDWGDPREDVVINPNSECRTRQLIPVDQRYRPRFEGRGKPDLHQTASLFSNGQGPLFLARCLRQTWNSVIDPNEASGRVTSYEVETFINTKIPFHFESGVTVMGSPDHRATS